MKKRSNKTPVIVLLLLVLLAAALLGGMVWFLTSHFFVGGRAYPNEAEALDLRDQTLTLEEYEQIRQTLPDCEIRWNIPFQNSAYPDSTTSLTLGSLSDEDLEVLSYFRELKEVDASACRDYAQLQKLQAQFPNVRVHYVVTIGGQDYANDAAAVTCPELTDEEIALMAYLPELKTVDASACRDYAQIGKLTAAYPQLDVSYQVELMGQTFTEADVSATFQDPDVDALMEKLAWLPHMENVHLVEPDASAEKLRELMETYPGVTITWDKTVLGKTFNSGDTEYDLSDLALNENHYMRWEYEPMDAAETTQIIRTVEEAMTYFPNAEKVILPAYHYDNETMADFREQMRPEYKVVWTVYITKKPVRTDQKVIHSSAMQVCLIDEQSYDLMYCEDAVVVDIGHSYVKYIEWVRYMPNLKYLVLAHNWIKDLTPISTCKNLVYLELFWNSYIPDYTPLLECTSLVDLNISGSPADPEPLTKMTWLRNLWANRCPFSAEQQDMLVSALPNTRIEFNGGTYTSLGWRETQGYYDMRDYMGLPYNHW